MVAPNPVGHAEDARKEPHTIQPAIEPDSHYRAHTWNADDGLPQNTVTALAQTPDGYLWIGTRFGLARFDGLRFVTFDEKNTEAFESHTIHGLHVDRSGALWIATQNGLIRFADGRFERFDRENGLPDNHVIQVTGGRAGNVWILSQADGKAISRYHDGRLDHFAVQEMASLEAASVFEDRKGLVWIARPWGTKVLNPITGELVEAPVLGNVESAVDSIVQDHTDAFWFGQIGGVFRYSADSEEFFPFPENFAKETAEYLSVDSEGALWVSTPRGPLRLFKGAWSFYPPDVDHQNTSISQVLEDQEGNFWFGSRAAGLHRIRLGKLRTYAKEQGLAHDSAWSVCESADGGLWIGTGGGLSRWFQQEFANFGNENGVPRGFVTTVCETKSGDLYFGMRDGGAAGFDGTAFLCRYRDGAFESLYPKSFQDLSRVWATFEDSRGTLWIGTRQGLFEKRDGEFLKYGTDDGLSHEDIRAITEDRNGTLWIGTNGGGVNRFQSGKFTSFSVEEGLSNPNAWSIHIDEDDTMWIGTEYGLNRFKDGQFTRYFQEDGLFDDLVNHILEDDFGNLWISCNRGIYRVRKRQLNDFAEGKLDRLRHVAYGTADGMLNSETNGECQPAGCKTRDGKLVFPTSKGIVVIDPKEALGKNSPPPVVIEAVSVNGKVIVSTEAGASAQPVTFEETPDHSVLRLAPGSGNVLQINYTANSLTDSSKAQFQYRLHGQHNEWIDAGRRRTALYTNLRPGEYRFQVVAANHNGVWNETGASLSFSIAPFFYQTIPFYSLIAMGVIALSVAIHRFILNQRMKLAHLQQQMALIQERGRIAQDMHDEMGGTLTEISLLGELAGQQESSARGSKSPIERIKRRSRELVQSMDGIVWATNPKHDTLESLVAYFSQYALNFLSTAGLRCVLDTPMPGEVPDWEPSSDLRHNLFLVFKESLTNIVKHAGATEITILCGLDGNTLFLLISDDGKGFSGSNSDRIRVGNGVANMIDRIRRIGGTLEIRPNRPSGTVVDVRIRIPG